MSSLSGAVDAAPPRGLVRALVLAARPRQWIKNVLVLSAPAAAGSVHEAAIAGPAALAVLAFCLASAGTYLINDARDVESDRRHPVKRRRPVACGDVPVGLAYVAGALLIAGSLALSAALSPALCVVLAVYVTVTTTYSVWLRRVPVVELAAVASGFVLRAVAGGVATGLALSGWFLVVVSAAALFVVTGKRFAELAETSGGAGTTRATLRRYSTDGLRAGWQVTAGVAVTAYAAWALQLGPPLAIVSTLPFALAFLRYGVVLERGRGGAPEDVLLGDRGLQLAGALWVVTFLGAVYAHG